MRPCEGGRPATWGVASPMLNWGVCWVLAFLFLPAIPLSAHITIPETSKTLSTAGEIAQAPDSASMESGAPEVPQVNIVGLPRETQDQVAKAYAAARKQPQDAGVVGKLGMLLDSYHRSEDAALCYRRAHLLEPAAFKWLYYWGSLLLRERKMGEALPILTSALRLDPEYLPARLKMGEALLGAGKTEEAGKIFEGILRDYSDTAEAYYGLGRGTLPPGLPVISHLRCCSLWFGRVLPEARANPRGRGAGEPSRTQQLHRSAVAGPFARRVPGARHECGDAPRARCSARTSWPY